MSLYTLCGPFLGPCGKTFVPGQGLGPVLVSVPVVCSKHAILELVAGFWLLRCTGGNGGQAASGQETNDIEQKHFGLVWLVSFERKKRKKKSGGCQLEVRWLVWPEESRQSEETGAMCIYIYMRGEHPEAGRTTMLTWVSSCLLLSVSDGMIAHLGSSGSCQVRATSNESLTMIYSTRVAEFTWPGIKAQRLPLLPRVKKILATATQIE
jgi:hypothetical protein